MILNERFIWSLGFHLSALVALLCDIDSDHDYDSGIDNISDEDHKKTYKVAINFDRRQIISVKCTCHSSAVWCSHVVAACLYRIREVPYHPYCFHSLSRSFTLM